MSQSCAQTWTCWCPWTDVYMSALLHVTRSMQASTFKCMYASNSYCILIWLLFSLNIFKINYTINKVFPTFFAELGIPYTFDKNYLYANTHSHSFYICIMQCKHPSYISASFNQCSSLITRFFSYV